MDNCADTETLREKVYAGAFSDLGGDMVIPKGVTEIGAGAFGMTIIKSPKGSYDWLSHPSNSSSEIFPSSHSSRFSLTLSLQS